MNYIKLINHIKQNGNINNYVIVDTRVVGGNSSTGDIVQINLVKIKNKSKVEKIIYIHPSFDWKEDQYKAAGVGKKEIMKGKRFEKAFKDFLDFTEGLILVSNQASAIQKVFSRNAKRAHVAFTKLHWLDVYLCLRLSFPTSKANSIGQFAKELKINYKLETISKGFNICNLIFETFTIGINKIIKENIKPKLFIDYERNPSEARVRLTSRLIIFFMLISLLIFMIIKL